MELGLRPISMDEMLGQHLISRSDDRGAVPSVNILWGDSPQNTESGFLYGQKKSVY